MRFSAFATILMVACTSDLLQPIRDRVEDQNPDRTVTFPEDPPLTEQTLPSLSMPEEAELEQTVWVEVEEPEESPVIEDPIEVPSEEPIEEVPVIEIPVAEDPPVIVPGTLSLHLSPHTPRSEIVVGASQDHAVTAVLACAHEESFLLNSLRVSNCVTISENPSHCAGEWDAMGSEDALTQIELSWESDAGVFMSALAPAGFDTDFEVLHIPIAQDDCVELTILADAATVGPTPDLSGARFQLNLNATREGGRLEAVGQTSGIVVTAVDVDTYVLGRMMILRQTKPTLALSPESPSGNAEPGQIELVRFTLAADTAGSVRIEELVIEIFSSDVLTTAEWILEETGIGPAEVPLHIAADTVRTFSVWVNASDATASETWRADVVGVGWLEADLPTAGQNGWEFIEHLPVRGHRLDF